MAAVERFEIEMTEFERGGHSAATEEPDLLAGDLFAFLAEI